MTVDHPRIEDDRIVDRYLAGRLPSEDEASFEEHLFACSACLAEVEAGEELRRGLRAVAAEDALRAGAARGLAALGLLAWLRGRRPGQLAGLALALLLVPAVVVWQQLELRRARAAVDALAGGAGGGRPTSSLLVVSLGPVRDAGDAAEIAAPSAEETVLLSLDLPGAAAASYRVTLRDEGGAVLWRGDSIRPSLYETLLVAVPSSFLTPGTYRITAESPTAPAGEGRSEMRLRVLPP